MANRMRISPSLAYGGGFVIMVIEGLYDALIEAGASEEKARAASRAMSDFDKRFTDIDKEIASFRAELAEFRTEVRGMFKLHGWILATHTAMLIALLFKVFTRQTSSAS